MKVIADIIKVGIINFFFEQLQPQSQLQLKSQLHLGQHGQ
jgi:hypothetical protein